MTKPPTKFKIKKKWHGPVGKLVHRSDGVVTVRDGVGYRTVGPSHDIRSDNVHNAMRVHAEVVDEMKNSPPKGESDEQVLPG